MAYYRIEPWGSATEDSRALYAGACSLAPHRSRPQPVQAKDFFPHLFRGQWVEMDDDEIAANLRGWLGG